MAKTYDEIMELIGKTAELTKDNSESTAIVLKKLHEQERLLGGLSKVVDGIDGKVEILGNDIEQLKLNEEVTTTQQETIVESAKDESVKLLAMILWRERNILKFLFKDYIKTQDKMRGSVLRLHGLERVIFRGASIT